jgi:hypothetical protein
MFISRLCVILVLAVNLINALPVLQTSGLERRVKEPEKSNNPKDWPTSEQLDKALPTGPGKATFWAGNTNGVSAQESADEHARKTGGTTLEGHLKDNDLKMPPWQEGNKAAEDKWNEASDKFAENAKGHVHAFVGDESRPNSVYHNREKKKLIENPNVHKLTEHRHPTRPGAKQVVHRKGGSPTRKPKLR